MASLTTTDHDTIRRWAEERGGKPSEVISTAREDDVGIIRIDFPGYGGEGKLREISWEDWFRKFDEASLALVYEEETSDGQRSNFNKLVGRETAQARAEGEKTDRRALRAVGRSPAGKRGGAPGGRRESRRAEAARTARPRKSPRSSAASRGSGSRGGKGTSGHRRSTRKAAGARRHTSPHAGRKNG
jgi:hypothetical protein